MLHATVVLASTTLQCRRRKATATHAVTTIPSQEVRRNLNKLFFAKHSERARSWQQTYTEATKSKRASPYDNQM